MIIVFECPSLKVTVDTEKKEAYFHGQDYLAPINSDNEFKDMFGCKYRYLPPLPHRKEVSDAYLEQLTWKQIARIEVVPAALSSTGQE